MIDKIIESALKLPGLVLIGVLVVVSVGVYRYQKMPVDAFPDISPIMVPVFAEGHGMAPEEIERLITYPIESAMNGLPGVTQIKSTSAFGMAVIYVYFKDNVNIYFARQLVGERLAGVMAELPEMHEPPGLGPISTGLGQIFIYYLEADPDRVDTGGKPLATWLRELNDWVVKFQLQTVPGVTDILSIGGHVLQYQIRVNPNALWKYDLTLQDLVEAVKANNRNVGGQFLVLGSEEHLVRGVGLVESLEDIRNIAIKQDDGRAVLLTDVADVEYGNEIRRGVVTRNGEKEVVSGLVLKLYGENTSQVIDKLYAKVEEVKKALPEGVELIPYYEQAELVAKATATVKEALLFGAILVVIVLFVFLGNLRSALIVTVAMPLCALFAVLCMEWRGISANLMSLGGIAIAIGMLTDGAVVMIENIYRHLSERGGGDETKDAIILDATREVARPIIFSIAIIIMVFLPIFALEGVEGKMFSPMAFTIAFAMGGSIIAAIVVTPVLAHYLLRDVGQAEFKVLRWLKAAYRPALLLALRFKKSLIGLALAAFMGAIAVVPFLGTEFIPTMEEGSIQIGVTMAPSTSLEEGTELVMEVEREIVQLDPVEEVISRIGRPEAGSHPHPVNVAEVHVELKPMKEWGSIETKAELIEVMREKLAGFPGIKVTFTQPIESLFGELLSGIRTDLAIKLYGEDLEVLREKADEIRAAIDKNPEAVDHIHGLVDVSSEQNYGQPQVQIVAIREACARYGVTVSDIMEMVELAVGGEVIDSIYLNTRRFGIHVRFQEPYRSDPEAIRNILVPTSEGGVIPLSQVAEVRQVTGPIQINREKNQRRWIVQGNVRGRDLGGVVADIQKRIAEKVTLPPGYTIEYGGQFENLQRAMARLVILLLIVILAVFVLLYLAFGTLRHALIILMNMPLALVGGVAGLLITGEYLSVPAAVGFIALFGIAVLNGVVMVSYFNQLVARGKSIMQAVEEGALLRLRPVLMTASVASFGLLPLLFSTGIGAEVQRPLAIVVVFGLATSTVLTLFVTPVVYAWVEGRLAKRETA